MAYFAPCLYAFGGSLAFAMVFNISKNKLLLSAIGGFIGQLTYLLFQFIISNDVALSLLATMAISLYAEMMARVTKSPTTVYLAVALIPLVPGGGVYYTMLDFIHNDIDLGITTGLHTLGISAALAMGIILISSSINLIRKVMLNRKRRKKESAIPCKE
ncbi:threonine/serine exporter family protein [Acetobacterium sp.]|uniref:threonine/serine exporter family protein n=1 Tax=Acetobacterium sp. TaxID=1872094 RepID=UPI002F41E5CA